MNPFPRFFAGALPACILTLSPATAHVSEVIGENGKSGVIFVTREILQQMNLPEHPKKMTRFDVQMGENSQILECRIRFAKKESALARAGCDFLRERVHWQPLRNKKGQVKKKRMKILLSWPMENAQKQKSDFGGALPVSIGAWTQKIDFAPLKKYQVARREFSILLNLDNKGIATACKTEPEALPQDLAKTICRQFLDHSRWLPPVDGEGRNIATTARIFSKLEIDPGNCLEGMGLEYRRKTGVLRWSIATGDDSCRFDTDQFGFPRR